MSYAASRRNGAEFERVAGLYVDAALGLSTPATDRSDAAGPLMEVLGRYSELSVGRNSTVEGVRVDPSGRVVVVECTGSTSVSRTPGCERPCTCRKLLGAAAAVAAVCRVEGIDPPGYVVITTALQHEQVVTYQRLLDSIGIELWSDEDLELLDHLACITAESKDTAVDAVA